jgi:hypothetical protein
MHLNDLEEKYILEKNSVSNGYNCFCGGQLNTIDDNFRKSVSIGMLNSKKLHNTMNTPEYREKISKAKIGNQLWLGKTHRLSSKKKISSALMGNKNSVGVIWSDERKKSFSKKMKGNSLGKGCYWINNGIIDRYNTPSDHIPEGWTRGRVFRKRKKF